MTKDYYKILGVSKNASEDEIKKAYRRLAHEYHPDRPHGDEKKFKEINEAYQILSNHDKKSQYDRFGQVFEGGGSPGSSQGFGASGFDPSQFGFEFSFGDSGGNINDIFETFFEGLGIKQKRKTYSRGADIEIVEEITLEDAFRQIKKKIKYKVSRHCIECSGLGHDKKSGVEECTHCGGRGEIRESKNSFFGAFSQVRQCSKCSGSGQVPKKPCASCRGTGLTMGTREVAIDIRPGVSDGQIIKIKGAGEDGSHGSESGDAYVKIVIKPHLVFSRHIDDLLIKKEIKALDILLGRKIEIPTIEGEKIQVEIPQGTNIRQMLRVPYKGMPHFQSSGRGDLLVEIDLKFPTKISDKARKLFEEGERNL